jgi:hypothetical protein
MSEAGTIRENSGSTVHSRSQQCESCIRCESLKQAPYTAGEKLEQDQALNGFSVSRSLCFLILTMEMIVLTSMVTKKIT